ncbi:MAG: glycosyltransferase family 2 protein [Patescibacteria group bacterium]
MSPDLSVIILSYRTKNLVKECVKSIRRAAPQLSYEIIVVDNASGDGVGEMMREQFPDIRFVESAENLGFAGGNNIGLREALGRYRMVLNPDIVVLPGALEKMVAAMDAHPEIGLLGPKLLAPDKSLQYSCYRFPSLLTPFLRRTRLGETRWGAGVVNRYLMADWDHAEMRDVDWLLGAALIVRAEALAHVGLFDDRFFLYFEDTDWARRFWKAGYRVVYFPEAELFHFHRRESAEGSLLESLLRRTTHVHVASAVKYFWKYREEDVPSRRVSA